MGPWFDGWVRKIHWRRDRLPTPVFLDFLVAQTVKNLGDLGSIPGLERSPGEESVIVSILIPWTRGSVSPFSKELRGTR